MFSSKDSAFCVISDDSTSGNSSYDPEAPFEFPDYRDTVDVEEDEEEESDADGENPFRRDSDDSSSDRRVLQQPSVTTADAELLKATIEAVMAAVGVTPTATSLVPPPAPARPHWGAGLPHVCISDSVSKIRAAVKSFLQSNAAISQTTRMREGGSHRTTSDALLAALGDIKATLQNRSVPMLSCAEARGDASDGGSHELEGKQDVRQDAWVALKSLFEDLARSCAAALKTSVAPSAPSVSVPEVSPETDMCTVAAGELAQLRRLSSQVEAICAREGAPDVDSIYSELLTLRGEKKFSAFAVERAVWASQAFRSEERRLSSELLALEKERSDCLKKLRNTVVDEAAFAERLQQLRQSGSDLREQWNQLQTLQQRGAANHQPPAYHALRHHLPVPSHNIIAKLEATSNAEWRGKCEALQHSLQSTQAELHAVQTTLDRLRSSTAAAAAHDAVIAKLLSEWEKRRTMDHEAFLLAVSQLVGRRVLHCARDETDFAVFRVAECHDAGATEEIIVDGKSPLPASDWSQPHISLQLASRLVALKQSSDELRARFCGERSALAELEGTTRSHVERDAIDGMLAMAAALSDRIKKQQLAEAEAAATQRAKLLFNDSPFDDEDVPKMADSNVPTAASGAQEQPGLTLTTATTEVSQDVRESGLALYDDAPTPPPSRKRSRSISPQRRATESRGGRPEGDHNDVPLPLETPLTVFAASSSFPTGDEPDAADPEPSSHSVNSETPAKCPNSEMRTEEPTPSHVELPPPQIAAKDILPTSPQIPLVSSTSVVPNNLFAEDGFWEE